MRIIDRSKEFRKELDAKVKRAFNVSSDAVTKRIQRQAPVLTGKLRDSIIKDMVSDFHARIGSDVDYAGIVEARTAFMRKGLFLSMDEVKEIFENEGFKVKKH